MDTVLPGLHARGLTAKSKLKIIPGIPQWLGLCAAGAQVQCSIPGRRTEIPKAAQQGKKQKPQWVKHKTSHGSLWLQNKAQPLRWLPGA